MWYVVFNAPGRSLKPIEDNEGYNNNKVLLYQTLVLAQTIRQGNITTTVAIRVKGNTVTYINNQPVV
jgi:hypothetical protein